MGPCMSLIAGAAGIPEIEYPGEEVATKTAEILAKLPAELDATETELKSQWESAKAKSEDYEVMGGKGGKTVLLVLKPTSEEKEVEKAAYQKVAKGRFAEEAAAQVWSQVEPKIDENKPEIPDTPVMTGAQIWAKAKEKVQEKVEAEVQQKIEEAVDEALKKKQAA